MKSNRCAQDCAMAVQHSTWPLLMPPSSSSSCIKYRSSGCSALGTGAACVGSCWCVTVSTINRTNHQKALHHTLWDVRCMCTRSLACMSSPSVLESATGNKMKHTNHATQSHVYNLDDRRPIVQYSAHKQSRIIMRRISMV